VPELPEVEIAARNLRAWTDGRSLVRLEASRGTAYVFRPATAARLARALEGARFRGIERRGKQLLVSLERDGEPVGLLAHLGMTGKWLRRESPLTPSVGASRPSPVGGAPESKGEAPRFSRARFHLDDGNALHFVDLRLFGRLRLVPGARFQAVRELAALGPDPLHDGIDPIRLMAALSRSRLPVKVRIMDQAILAGVGNILASEACFRARVDARRRADSLSRAEVKRLADGVLAVVRDTIVREEGPEIAYVEEGAENPFLVYDRAGEHCPRCRKGRIVRLVQAGRSTYLCPRCQR
jgi:formamidopyrimidine-DNA glycosylase